MTAQRKAHLKRRIQAARQRLRRRNSDFARPLWELLYIATKEVYRISTNGACIYFDPDWLQKLSDDALEFILAHQMMHIALGHIDRPKFYTGDRFHLACDIVANSNLETLGWQEARIPQIGRIFKETFFLPQEGRSLTVQQALTGVPFDPATLTPGVRRTYMIDSEEWWDRKQDRGERGVLVLSPEDDDPEEADFYAADGGMRYYRYKEQFREGNEIAIEEVEKTEKGHGAQPAKQDWERSALDELKSLRGMKFKNEHAGREDDFKERPWQRPNAGTINWRTLLNCFVQEEVYDYSFSPPDRRLQDTELFLPDYNVLAQRPKEVWFMVDTSGSINEDVLLAVYQELFGALTQFNGGLIGRLGFFDHRVYPTKVFSEAEDLAQMVPRGGGGTNFHCIFDYLNAWNGEPPASLVIFTDGQAEFPVESAAGNIPVLWLFSKKRARAPWGKVAYIVPEEQKED